MGVVGGWGIDDVLGDEVALPSCWPGTVIRHPWIGTLNETGF